MSTRKYSEYDLGDEQPKLEVCAIQPVRSANHQVIFGCSFGTVHDAFWSSYKKHNVQEIQFSQYSRSMHVSWCCSDADPPCSKYAAIKTGLIF